MWSYAKLSNVAKLCGGPEKLVCQLVETGVKRGKLEMVPWVIMAGAIGVVSGPVINYLKGKYAQYQTKIESTKVELIQGIKDYETAQEQEGDNSNE